MRGKFLFILCIVVILSCTPKNEGEQKILKVALPANPTTMDPYYRLDGQSVRVMVHIFDGLVTRDIDEMIIPQLAESWNQDSDLEWTFKIKKDVTFHNGNPLTSEDVVYSMNRMKESPAMGSYISLVTNIEAVDPLTVKFHLSAPFAPLLAVLAMENVVILDKETVSADVENAHLNPIGTGPFKFAAWASGDYITLDAFSEYRDGVPKIDRIIFNVMPEATTRSIALETGELDISYGLDIADYSIIKNNASLDAIIEPLSSVLAISGNFKKDFWQDPKVREAINLAIDRNGIAQIQHGTDVQPRLATSFVPDQVFGKTNLSIVTQDIEKAKELMSQSAFADGLKISITVPGDYRSRIAEIIQANLKDIGIDLSINVREWGAYLEDQANGRHDLSLFGWISSTLDADLSLDPKLHSKNRGTGGNYTFYNNKEFDVLIDQAKQESSLDKRKELYAQAQKIIYQDIPLIPLYYSPEFVGIKKNIKGFYFSPTFTHSLRNVSIGK